MTGEYCEPRADGPARRLGEDHRGSSPRRIGDRAAFAAVDQTRVSFDASSGSGDSVQPGLSPHEAAEIVHDLNNALHVILGHSKLLGETPHDAHAAEDIAAIEAAAQQAASLTLRLKGISSTWARP
jgi:hypothetical protein